MYTTLKANSHERLRGFTAGASGARVPRAKPVPQVAETGVLPQWRQTSVATAVRRALRQVVVGSHDLGGTFVRGVWPTTQTPLGH